ncbi:DUF1272 domain-containing protein [Litoribrevibacter albus]|uniref:DUF1272 domain-containing protein n=1 Tax=Litoribrevibacter albus TaxID=1473156 RepID=A0AA37W6N8_9GAMM|nr:DUF1272 domain-containing protein [Litoribrevibacter albus]GLQ29651.1 DUF1272 domain-containing protein [Litoribrevibacter albus]
MLKMKKACEKCSTPLGFTDQAFICSYECTFCPDCTTDMNHVCPNCEGELVRRPTREKGVAQVAANQIKHKLFGK